MTDTSTQAQEPSSVDSRDKAEKFDFSSRYSSNLPAILANLQISLAVTSYQSQRMVLVRSRDGELDTNLKFFPRPMGVYADRERLTIGTLTEVINFKRSDAIWRNVKSGALDDLGKMPRKLQEKDPERAEQHLASRATHLQAIKAADALFCQRASITTGMINIHDIAWGNEGLWVVNSTFSCLSTLSPDCNFVARWCPYFIDEYVPQDRCHLNGMAMLNGEPRYVTTFNQSNRQDSWIKDTSFNGTLMDVQRNEVVVEGLIMPHSPRCYNGKVYYCESGRGEIQIYDPERRETSVLCSLPGFTRGMAFMGDLMWVGTSECRTTQREILSPLEEKLNGETGTCGVWLIDPRTGEQLAHLHFEGDVAQIYDIAVIPDSTCPEFVQSKDVLAGHLFDFFEEIYS